MAKGNTTTFIDYNLLSEYLSYDKDSGFLFWIKKPCSRIVVGAKAGCVKCKKRGYIVFSLRGQHYYAHRVAWVLATMASIDEVLAIDHINGDTTDNRLLNLRLATQSQNLANSMHSLGASGKRGVVWCKSKKKWQAQISSGNKTVFLGRFKTIEEAAAARESAEKRLFGEYSYRESRGIPNEISQ